MAAGQECDQHQFDSFMLSDHRLGGLRADRRSQIADFLDRHHFVLSCHS